MITEEEYDHLISFLGDVNGGNDDQCLKNIISLSEMLVADYEANGGDD